MKRNLLCSLLFNSSAALCATNVVEDALYVFFSYDPVCNALSLFDFFGQLKKDAKALIVCVKPRLCEICEKGFRES